MPLLAIAALALSWLSGYWLMRVLVGGRGDGAMAVHVGYGYFLGLLMTVMLISLFARAGLGVHDAFLPAVLGLFLVIAVAVVREYIRGRACGPDAEAFRWFASASRLQTWLFIGLAAWVVIRVGMIELESGLRPLFPWDAWMHWSPKAKVWIETGQWLEFGSRSSWLDDASRSIYTIRNWSYPSFVPLVQTWTLMPVGGWHETAFGFSWALALPAVVLATYGITRVLGFNPLASIGVCWILISLPFLHVHAALPGYADLWLGAYASLAAGALLIATRGCGWAWLLLGLLFAAGCTWIKSPGLAWFAVLSCGVLAWIPGRRYQLWAILAAGLAIAALLLVGVDADLPALGTIWISSGGFELPMIGRYEWQFNPVISSLLEQLFFHPEWHFLWWLFVTSWIYTLFASARDRASVAAMFMTGAGVLFLVIAVLFTSRGADLEVTRLTHRAFLPLAMIGVICLPALFRHSGVAAGSQGVDREASMDEPRKEAGGSKPA